VVHLQNVSVSSGMRAGDLEKLKVVLELVPEIEYICLDVANGYSEHFVEFVKQVRREFPRHTIMVFKFFLFLFVYFPLTSFSVIDGVNTVILFHHPRRRLKSLSWRVVGPAASAPCHCSILNDACLSPCTVIFPFLLRVGELVP